MIVTSATEHMPLLKQLVEGQIGQVTFDSVL